ncbi:Hypp1188 [Branchiostoma lanceolatum]|uniref:Hypp1188 protein n=1 Tax=Branchiostoma lanceolatum TaxID=7740 RepID=A0A8K0EMC8_BRALA|nr:Hypp1188 [Branchiostoma lanceolatum]
MLLGSQVVPDMSTSVTIVGGVKLVQKLNDNNKVQTVSMMVPHHSRDLRDEEIQQTQRYQERQRLVTGKERHHWRT